MKPKPDDLLARRYLSLEKLEQLKAHPQAEVIGPRLVRTFDITRNGWTEFVGVTWNDPRLDTVETLK